MTSWLLRSATTTAAMLTAHAAVNALLLRRPGAAPSQRPHVSVLIPARNEARRIGNCVRAVLASPWPDLEVLVLDDQSNDGTADVVRRVAAGDPRLIPLEGAPLPPGWLGKPWACAQLGAAAGGEILIFVDADVVLVPGAVAALVSLLDAAPLDLACPYPRQLGDGPLPRLVQPLLQWSWLTFLPLRLAESPWSRSMTAANGQLLACTAAAYARAGGHTAVRNDVLEDLALARAFKRSGLRAGVTDGTALATCRMYDSGAELVDGYTKSLWAAFGSPAGAVVVGAGLSWLYVLPAAALLRALVRGDWAQAQRAGSGYLAGVAGRVIAALRTGGRPLDAAAHPASIAVLSWLIARSLAGHRRGTLHWRGRSLSPNMAPATRRSGA